MINASSNRDFYHKMCLWIFFFIDFFQKLPILEITGLPAPLRESVKCPRGDVFYDSVETANNI